MLLNQVKTPVEFPKFTNRFVLEISSTVDDLKGEHSFPVTCDR